MLHPYSIAKSGNELISLFKKTVESIKNGNGSVKFDGVNTSVRFNGSEFVIDRGTAKELDIKGVTIKDLPNRFGEGHGLIPVCTEVLNFFNSSLNSCREEYKKLGLLTNNNLLLNIDYINNKLNIIDYKRKMIVIHDIKEVFIKKYKKDGITPLSRSSSIINYNQGLLDKLIKKLNLVNKDIKILGRVPVRFRTSIDIDRILNHTCLILYPYGYAVKKSLYDWLQDIDNAEMKITKLQFEQVLGSKNISSEFENVESVINDAIMIMTTLVLGKRIKFVTETNEGELMCDHEGIVIRDKSIIDVPYKITGTFILDGMNSPFAK